MEEFKAKGGVAGAKKREKADAKKDLMEKRAKKRARQERDADKPKKPPTGYWIWLGEKRSELVKEAGTAKGPVVAKLGGEKWKAMDAKQKAPFEKIAAEKRAEYEKALKEYKEKKGEAADDDEEEDEDEEEDGDEQ